MKVTFKRSGGFAPMPVSCVMDTKTCDPTEAATLQQLVIDSTIMMTESASVRGARDVRYYSFDIEYEGMTKHVSFDELSVPKEIRPLIEFMQSRATSIFGDD